MNQNDPSPKEIEATQLLLEQRDAMIMDALLRITAVENLLIRKQILLDEEIQTELVILSKTVAKSVQLNLAAKEDLQPVDVEELEVWTNSFLPKKKEDKSN